MMSPAIKSALQEVFTLRCRPSKDLAVVGLSWLLVVGALYAATNWAGPEAAGGMAYFGLYAVLGALIFGVGLPLGWMVVVRGRPLADLGLTTRGLALSLVLQVVFAALQFSATLAKTALPPDETLVPLLALSLAIGFFEALFWRGWVLLRLEEAFGLLPAILLGSVLYAAYHIGYGMPVGEMVFLFFIGILYAVAFRLTKSVFVLWPLFQPMGQMVTLIKDGLALPLLSALGFAEVLIAMLVLVWLAGRYHRRRSRQTGCSRIEEEAL